MFWYYIIYNYVYIQSSDFLNIRLFFFFSDYTYIVYLPLVNLIFENSDV